MNPTETDTIPVYTSIGALSLMLNRHAKTVSDDTYFFLSADNASGYFLSMFDRTHYFAFSGERDPSDLEWVMEMFDLKPLMVCISRIKARGNTTVYETRLSDNDLLMIKLRFG